MNLNDLLKMWQIDAKAEQIKFEKTKDSDARAYHQGRRDACNEHIGSLEAVIPIPQPMLTIPDCESAIAGRPATSGRRHHWVERRSLWRRYRLCLNCYYKERLVTH